VKAARFRYSRPSTVDEALDLKAEGGEDALFLAGGQSLLPIVNFRLSRPELLIDINCLEELDGIEADGDMVRIGALTRTSEVGSSAIIAEHLPMLHEAAPHIAHAAIRNLGTFGGSIALGDGAAEWPACCLALDATIVLRSKQGDRKVAASEFFLGLFSTARRHDELLVRVDIPKQKEGSRSVVLELCRRRGDFAIVGIAGHAGPGIAGAKLAFFGVSDRPVRLAELERELAGGASLDSAREVLVEALPAEADLYHDVATKKYLAGHLLGQALEKLAT
jgi:aerobic carbon-monoxide dehydrogenase medium subunit